MITDIINNYFSAEHVDLGPNGVKQGFYTITNPKDILIGARVEKALVAARWKPDQSVESSLPVIVQLSTLYNKYSVGPKEIDPSYLTGATIKIVKVEKQEYCYEGKDCFIRKVEWEIIDWPKVIEMQDLRSDVSPIIDSELPFLSDYEEEELFLLANGL